MSSNTIYKITNPAGKIYVGKTKNLALRLKWYAKYSYLATQPKLMHSINKYGWTSHTVSILEECPAEIGNERERFWIRELKSYHYDNPSGLNLTPGGDGGAGRKGPSVSNTIFQISPDTLEVIKAWPSATSAAAHFGVSRNSIYAATKNEKQVYCKGFMWSYAPTVPPPRKYKYGSSSACLSYSIKLKQGYADGLLTNPQKGKVGKLNKRSKPIRCLETGQIFESVRRAAAHFIEAGLLKSSLPSATEFIRTNAAGITKRNRDLNFVYL